MRNAMPTQCIEHMPDACHGRTDGRTNVEVHAAILKLTAERAPAYRGFAHVTTEAPAEQGAAA